MKRKCAVSRIIFIFYVLLFIIAFITACKATTSGGSVDSVSIKEGSASTGADPGASMTKAYGESLSFNAVVADSPDEEIVWTTSNSAVATISPSGTDNKQVSVTIVNSSGTATITAASQADSSKTDFLTITAEKKSISSIAMTYTALTIDEGDTTANTAAAALGNFLVGNDDLADAVTFSIARKTGTGPEPGTDISIDPATGTITIAPAQTAFTATTYTVTMTGKNHYKDSKTADITLTVNAGTSGDSVDLVSIKEGLTSAGADPGGSMTKAYGESFSFNAVVDVSGSPDEGIIWTTSDNAVATISPSGTENKQGTFTVIIWTTFGNAVATISPNGADNKQISVTIMNSSGDATITAASQADSSKTDSLTITAEKKSISSIAMTYTALTIDEGDATGNTAAAALGNFLVGNDDLADAVTFSIARKSGTGPEPGTDVIIDPATGDVTINPAQTAFTATTYTVTMTGKNHYKDSKTADITLTVNAIPAAYGIPTSISASTNTGGQLALSWDEFDSDTDTIYTVYAYNLTIRTSGGTAPSLEEFLRVKDEVADVTAVMSEVSAVEQWTGLADPSTAASQLEDLRLHPGHKYVFVVTGTRSGNLDTDTMAAAIIDIAGTAPAVYGTPSSGGSSFPVVLIAEMGVGWKTAAHYSRAQGGRASLVEIGSQAEQNAVVTAIELVPDTEITKIAKEGSGARYLWIGATDEKTEGTWVWNGVDDDTASTPLGTGTGSLQPTNNWTGTAYQNWGTVIISYYDHGFQQMVYLPPRMVEPNNSPFDQDFAAIGIDKWANGSQYQWNDIPGMDMLSGYVMEVAQDW